MLKASSDPFLPSERWLGGLDEPAVHAGHPTRWKGSVNRSSRLTHHVFQAQTQPDGELISGPPEIPQCLPPRTPWQSAWNPMVPGQRGWPAMLPKTKQMVSTVHHDDFREGTMKHI